MKARSTRGTLALAVGALAALVLVPVGVEAATDNVIIKDADSSAKAQVVSGGRLKIGDGSGPLTVDGAVGTVPEPAPSPFQRMVAFTEALVSVPIVDGIEAGKALHVTSLTVANTHDTNDIHLVLQWVELEPGNSDCNDLPFDQDTLTGVVVGPNDTAHLTFPEPVTVPIGIGEKRCLLAAFEGTPPDWLVNVTVVGYMTP